MWIVLVVCCCFCLVLLFLFFIVVIGFLCVFFVGFGGCCLGLFCYWRWDMDQWYSSLLVCVSIGYLCLMPYIIISIIISISCSNLYSSSSSSGGSSSSSSSGSCGSGSSSGSSSSGSSSSGSCGSGSSSGSSSSGSSSSGSCSSGSSSFHHTCTIHRRKEGNVLFNDTLNTFYLRLTARVLLYAPSHRQDSTYHGLCYTSRGALAGRASIDAIALWNHCTLLSEMTRHEICPYCRNCICVIPVIPNDLNLKIYGSSVNILSFSHSPFLSFSVSLNSLSILPPLSLFLSFSMFFPLSPDRNHSQTETSVWPEPHNYWLVVGYWENCSPRVSSKTSHWDMYHLWDTNPAPFSVKPNGLCLH